MFSHRLYDTFDGLAGAPLGSIRSVRGADGRLWFVRGGGLTLVDVRTVEPARTLARAPVRIERAVANESRLSPTPQTQLPCRITGVCRSAILRSRSPPRTRSDSVTASTASIRNGLMRDSPPGVLHEPFAARLSIQGRGRHRGRHADLVDGGMGLCDPPGLLSIELVLRDDRRDDRIGRLGRLASPASDWFAVSSRSCWLNARA